ncbi:MAG: hypothetical protein HQM07_09680 [Zetaproteobacteria bacterium]|nr:hypothetical protein [Zetaproteobacteria bacterium]
MLMIKSGKVMARVEGMADPFWLHDNGEKDHGKRGETIAIGEKNLMDEIAERIKKTDLKRSLEETKQRWWERNAFTRLGHASKDETHSFAPLVISHKDILAPDGSVIVPKGLTINPLERMPFTRAIIAYDPSHKGEREKAIELVQQARANNRVPVVMITEPTERSFEGLFAEKSAIGEKVFLLNDQICQRFHIQRTPSMVTANDGMFFIHEYAID